MKREYATKKDSKQHSTETAKDRAKNLGTPMIDMHIKVSTSSKNAENEVFYTYNYSSMPLDNENLTQLENK